MRDGILCHTTGTQAQTLKASWYELRTGSLILTMILMMRSAHRSAFQADIQKEIVKVLGGRRTARIDTLVKSVVRNSGDDIRMDDEVKGAFDELHDFMYRKVYLNPYVKGEERRVADRLTVRSSQADRREPDLKHIAQTEGEQRRDYIAGMTDHFAVSLFKEIYIPKGWNR